MRRVLLSDDALRGLGEIYRYIRESSGSPSVARKRVASIRARCSELASLPRSMGRSPPELGQDIRSAVSGAHVVFFRYAGDDVFEVVAILEGHRDMDAYFGLDA